MGRSSSFWVNAHIQPFQSHAHGFHPGKHLLHVTFIMKNEDKNQRCKSLHFCPKFFFVFHLEDEDKDGEVEDEDEAVKDKGEEEEEGKSDQQAFGSLTKGFSCSARSHGIGPLATRDSG